MESTHRDLKHPSKSAHGRAPRSPFSPIPGRPSSLPRPKIVMLFTGAVLVEVLLDRRQSAPPRAGAALGVAAQVTKFPWLMFKRPGPSDVVTASQSCAHSAGQIAQPSLSLGFEQVERLDKTRVVRGEEAPLGSQQFDEAGR